MIIEKVGRKFGVCIRDEQVAVTENDAVVADVECTIDCIVYFRDSHIIIPGLNNDKPVNGMRISETQRVMIDEMLRATARNEEQRKAEEAKAAYEKFMSSNQVDIARGCDTGTFFAYDYCSIAHGEKFHAGSSWTRHCIICDEELEKLFHAGRLALGADGDFFASHDVVIEFDNACKARIDAIEKKMQEKKDKEAVLIAKAKEAGKKQFVRSYTNFDCNCTEESNVCTVSIFIDKDGKYSEEHCPSY